MSCHTCSKSVRSSNDAVTCCDCNNKFHGNCVGLKTGDLKYITDNKKTWRCESCTREKRRSIAFETSMSSDDISLKQVVQMISEVRADIRRMELDLGKSIDSCHEDVADILHKFEKQEKQLALCLEKIDSQALEINILKKQNHNLQRAVSDLQQYTRSNCLELHNYPQEKNEDLIGVVKSVSKALGHELTDMQIDNCHRLPTRDQKKTPPIIIKLTRRIDKEEILRRRRVKRDFSTRHLNLPSDIPLYVNESLAPERRKVLALAKVAKTEKAYKYLWIRNGKILMRKSDGKPVISLETVDDLDKLETTKSKQRGVSDESVNLTDAGNDESSVLINE
ncbi:uncharacterized protein LOC120352170 [Nilaparvata lugens]|uniref:uncharacterized protein LOC120352170 n=1 Tax=Nilaparvata lugens TaxID=108931 RepID=UPI00193CD8FB|nr:uncharacterized protein LOC120352170 [Nilaparvata lugens]